MELKAGLKGTKSVRVTRENTARALASGLLEVYATPMLVALMEEAAAELAAPYLNEGDSTVGGSINAMHTAATPVGLCAYAEAELIEVSGRMLRFNIRAWDDAGEIGRAEHTRFIVNNERFMDKAQKKLAEAAN